MHTLSLARMIMALGERLSRGYHGMSCVGKSCLTLTFAVTVIMPVNADPLDQWHWRDPLPQGRTLHNLSYGNGRYVLVGDRGAVMTSADAVNWTVSTLPSTTTLNGIIFVNGRFVAVGAQGLIALSTDAASWNEQSLGNSFNLNSVGYGNGTLVAVGSSGRLFTSSDGTNWSAQASGTTQPLNAVVFGGGGFVAVGSAGTTLTSSDGTNWTTCISGTTADLLDVAYGGGQFAAVTHYDAVRSFDGTNWQAQSHASFYWLNGVTWDGNQFVGCGYGFASSSDGLNWTWSGLLPGGLLNKCARLNDDFMLIGQSGTCWTSTDLEWWNEVCAGAAGGLNSIAYGAGQFVAVGYDYLNHASAAWSSPDAVNWTRRVTPTTREMLAVAHGSNSWVAVGGGGTILTSGDLGNWRSQTTTDPRDLSAVAFGNGLFVACGSTEMFYTSPDGTNWLSQTVLTNGGIHGLTYAAGQFVAVGSPGQIFTSPDGLNWTSRPTSTSATLFGVAYGAGKFVAIGGNTIITSEDGVSWTVQNSELATSMQGIAFGGGVFCVVGYDGNLSSSDGQSWQIHRPAPALVTRVAAGANTFVAVDWFSGILQSDPLVGTPPTIVKQPESQTAGAGELVDFASNATGSSPLSFQWVKDGSAAGGANNPILELRSPQIADAGDYYLIVSNSFGAATSIVANLTITSNLAGPLEVWRRQDRTPGDKGAQPICAVYGQNKFVAVGYSGSIVLSSDALHWADHSVSDFGDCQGIAYGNGVFVVVGTGRTNFVSTDGFEWQGVPNHPDFYDVTFGNGLFAAVNSDYSGSAVYSSSNGINWVQHSIPVTGTYQSITFGNGLFVIAGWEANYTAKVLTTRDFVTWTTFGATNASSLNRVAYGDGAFVAVGYAGDILQSPDGFNWSHLNLGATNDLLGVYYGNGRFIAGGNADPIGIVFTSPDGLNWARTWFGTKDYFHSGAYGNGRFVIFSEGSTVLVSSDGTNWTAQSESSSDSVEDAIVTNGLLVAVAPYGDLLTSSNGLNWTVHDAGPYMPRSLAYGNGIYVALGFDGIALVSTDGLNWTAHRTGAQGPMDAVAFGNGIFVAGGGAYQTPEVCLSTNGVDWSCRTFTGENMVGIAAGNGIFVAIPSNEHYVLTSSDGWTWTPRSTTARNAFNGVRFANGIFFALASNGDNILSSIDGVNWIARWSTGDSIQDLAYGAGYYAAAARTDVLVTRDLIHWRRYPIGKYGLKTLVYAGNYFVGFGLFGEIYKSDPIIPSAPVIADALTSQDILVGGPVSFTVAAFGTSPVTFQWFKDGIAILGATNTTLEIKKVNASDVAIYTLVASNAMGTATNRAFILSVSPQILPTVSLYVGAAPEVTIESQAGLEHSIDSSADLFTWQTETNLPLPRTRYTWKDPLPATNSAKFYRVRRVL